ncbi:hypothetical protein [Thalassospira alkalitolerans]|uniref:hypothetical protein n=1 Tax=Thalassospira alkalitolerans TaxID=1293890 RepID=UPI003AA7E1F3
MSKQTVAMIVQCALSIVIGYFTFVWLIGTGTDNPKVPVIGSVITGIVGSWLLMKLYVLARYGWSAMKSMTWDAD